MSGTGGFQTQAYNQPVMAIAGDFASNNPYFTYDAGPGGLVSGSGGVTVGQFAWVQYPTDSDGTPSQVYNTPQAAFSGTHGFNWGISSLPDGIVHREQQALITTYLGYSSMVIVPGQQMSLMNGGDLWVANSGTTVCQYKMKAFARLTDGAVFFSSSGANVGVQAIATTAAIASTTWTGTGTIIGNTLSVTGVVGSLYPGVTIQAPGVGVIIDMIAGSTTGVGTFLLSVGEQSVTSTNLTGYYGIITVSAGSAFTAPLQVGEMVSGSGVVTSPPTVITYFISGATSTVTVTAVVNNTLAVALTTMTFNYGSVETKWWAVSQGNSGELVKITDHPPQ